MTWTREPAWEGPVFTGCGHAIPYERIAPMDMVIGVGFGFASVSKDGNIVYQETEDKKHWTVADAEKRAVRSPDHDWRITLAAPLRDAVWQRHSEGQWVMIQSGRGFA